MFGKKKIKMEYDAKLEAKDKRIRLLTIEVAELKQFVQSGKNAITNKIDYIATLNQIHKNEMKHLETQVVRFNKEKEDLKMKMEELLNKSESRTIGFMGIGIPSGLNDEKSKEFQATVLTQMEENMKRIGIELDLVIIPQVVQNFQVVTLDMKKEEMK